MKTLNHFSRGGVGSWGIVAVLLAAAQISGAAQIPARQLLFNGHDLAGWRLPAGEWISAKAVRLAPADDSKFLLEAGQGVLVNGTQGRTINLLTAAEFGDVQAHVEFSLPRHSNSGLYFMGRYELQIYDSFGVNKDKYPGIECGGIYPRWSDGREHEGHSPRVNASKPPGEWQVFDVVFRAPRFDAEGKKTQNAVFVKVVHNGQVIHENVEVTGPTRAAFFENDERAAGPLMLQGDHGPIAFRNLWVIPAQMRPGTSEKQLVEEESKPVPAGDAGSLKERAVNFLADTRILALAKATLLDQKALQSKYLRVRSDNGVVFLDGFVRQPSEEALARKKISEIEGVTRVVERCVVWPGLGVAPEYETRFSGPAEDTFLAARIRAALLKAVAEKALPWEMSVLSVEVFRGDAQVFAVVPKAELADTIAGVAKGIRGVNNCQAHVCLAARE